MTLSYLDAQKIPYKKSDDFSFFSIPGGAAYKPINGFVTGDFSSAAFPVCAALTCDSGNVTLLGLDPHDSQGDKTLLDMLSQMGADIKWSKADNKWELHVSRSKRLKGGTFDLNASPDLLPVMSALAAYSEGETALVNVAHARIKETDRIAVMAQELAKVGIKTEERPDALIIHGGEVQGGNINGHGDHRIVMAFAVAALGAKGAITIEGAEAASVTYPGFLEHLGAEIVN
jgi:3-phosphoshikimate 1-carboxyvinyltransferase